VALSLAVIIAKIGQNLQKGLIVITAYTSQSANNQLIKQVIIIMSRKIEIDWAMVEELAMIQCTGREIAAVLNVAHSTLTGRKEYSDIYKKGQENGKMSLRRLQWASAQGGHVGMQIWLGKNWLNQSDTLKVENTDTLKVLKIETE